VENLLTSVANELEWVTDHLDKQGVQALTHLGGKGCLSFFTPREKSWGWILIQLHDPSRI
jgi:hypothetical protein